MSDPNPPTDSGSADSDEALIGPSAVRALLNRRGIPSYRHVSTLAQVLGVGHTVAWKRMKGASAWELEELEKIAVHFGETLADLFAPENAEASVLAMMLVEGLKVPCQLVVGDPVRDVDKNSLVANKVGEQWLVLPAARAGVGQSFGVKHLSIRGNSGRRRRIAILDDDVQDAKNMAEHFAERGCDVQAFTTAEELIGHAKANPFDAYVLDWVLGEGSAAELIAMLRADDPDCMIAVLTGKMIDDLDIEQAVGATMAAYKLQFFLKPTPPHIISSQLLPALAGR